MLTDLLVRDWRSVCAMALASRKSRMSDILCMSEPDASGGCVADPVARAKEERRLDTFTVPKWAQPAGRINRASMMRLALVAVNREGRLAERAVWANQRQVEASCGRSSMVEH